jgi:hypothetical protein
MVLEEVGTTRTNFLGCDVMLSSRSWRSFELMYYLRVQNGKVSPASKQADTFTGGGEFHDHISYHYILKNDLFNGVSYCVSKGTQVALNPVLSQQTTVC